MWSAILHLFVEFSGDCPSSVHEQHHPGAIHTQLKQFDVIIKPILYGSDVWGACMLTNVNTLFKRVHSKVCKYILQVNKIASNFAVRSELGRYPLYINIRTSFYYLNTLLDSQKYITPNL